MCSIAVVDRQPGLVSTVIPVFNRPRELVEAVTSVLQQDYRPIEIIIVDDGSTDGTEDAARELASRHSSEIRVLRQSNLGPGAAREAGRVAARGQYIQYLDSDDILLPRKFARQVVALRESRADIAYGWVRLRRSDGSVVEGPWKRTGDELVSMFPLILVERWWETACPLYTAAIGDRAGPWLPLWQEEDWEYDCRVGATGARLVKVDDFVCEHRHHDNARLSREGSEPNRLRDRARAQLAMLDTALACGMPLDSREFGLFARRLFLLSRQCGAKGLVDESRRLFRAARRASVPDRRGRLDFMAYSTCAAVLGWRMTGRLSCWSDRFRRRAGES